MYLICTGVTVGFERQSYSFAEPDAGTSLIRENICVTVSQGVLGFPLIIVPQWTDVSATGKETSTSMFFLGLLNSLGKNNINFLSVNQFGSISSSDSLIIALYIILAGVGQDYSPPTGRYRLDADETSDCLEVTIFNDIILEEVEQFTGQLVGFEVDGSVIPVIPNVIVQPQRTTAEITDNDGKLTIFRKCSSTSENIFTSIHNSRHCAYMSIFFFYSCYHWL